MKLLVKLILCLLVLGACDDHYSKVNPNEETVGKAGQASDSINPIIEFDAPYVYTEGNKLLINRIMRKAHGEELEVKTFAQPKTADLDFTVFVNHIRKDLKDFKVKVKPNAVFNHQDQWKTTEDILVVSDVEGEFFHFVDFLQSAGVIDANYHWTYGKKHLIVLGDTFDRGQYVHELLWLLYKLESEGANIHMLYGNHDVMNFSGYMTAWIQPKYFRTAKLFHKEPKDLYKANSILGAWFRNKNIIERGNDFLFVHGGISRPLYDLHPDMTFAGLNSVARRNLDTPLASEAVDYLASGISLLWYRGYFLFPLQPEEDLVKILAHFQAKMVISGHTVQDHVHLLYGGKVAGVNVQIHNGQKEGLLLNNEGAFRVEAKQIGQPATITKLQ